MTDDLIRLAASCLVFGPIGAMIYIAAGQLGDQLGIKIRRWLGITI